MNERQSDFELLQDFARRGEQGAFGRLVRRHLDLVYATAFLKLQESGAAQEVAQNTFAALARKSWQFGPDDSVPAWLYKTAVLESKQWLRGEMRRRRREQTAVELGTTMKNPEEQPALRALLPLLDEAMLSLREQDRAALLLRYYENQSLREVGTALGVGEDAAQKRVAGALDKLTGFFRRRGYKTATVAAAAAALEYTAASAPAAVAGAVVSSAAQLAPPALVGVAALAARLASWSKMQTATVCLAVALAPVAWQWRELEQARSRNLRAQEELQTAKMRVQNVQEEIERLTRKSELLQASVSEATGNASRQAELRQRYEAWKKRLRAQLLAEDYRWPEDSPFVRVPKSAIRRLNVRQPVALPGVVLPVARELLGLSPEDRQAVEGALKEHVAAMDQLILSRIQETNRPAGVGVWGSAVAQKGWVIPPLGGDAKDIADGLVGRMQSVLGPERWPLVAGLLETRGTDTLRNMLNLDAAEEGQQLGVWVSVDKGQPMAGYGWATKNSMCSMSLGPLAWFGDEKLSKPEAPPRPPNLYWGEMLSARGVAEPLKERMLAWLEQEASVRLGKEASR
jgi:RNA polymerase sigma factor (sigma-70 family)